MHPGGHARQVKSSGRIFPGIWAVLEPRSGSPIPAGGRARNERYPRTPGQYIPTPAGWSYHVRTREMSGWENPAGVQDSSNRYPGVLRPPAIQGPPLRGGSSSPNLDMCQPLWFAGSQNHYLASPRQTGKVRPPQAKALNLTRMPAGVLVIGVLSPVVSLRATAGYKL